MFSIQVSFGALKVLKNLQRMLPAAACLLSAVPLPRRLRSCLLPAAYPSQDLLVAAFENPCSSFNSCTVASLPACLL